MFERDTHRYRDGKVLHICSLHKCLQGHFGGTEAGNKKLIQVSGGWHLTICAACQSLHSWKAQARNTAGFQAQLLKDGMLLRTHESEFTDN